MSMWHIQNLKYNSYSFNIPLVFSRKDRIKVEVIMHIKTEK